MIGSSYDSEGRAYLGSLGSRMSLEMGSKDMMDVSIKRGRIGFASGYFCPHSMGSLDIPFESSLEIQIFPMCHMRNRGMKKC